jgi:hypothetical protein
MLRLSGRLISRVTRRASLFRRFSFLPKQKYLTHRTMASLKVLVLLLSYFADSTQFLNQKEATQMDLELMSPDMGFTVDILMELAGMLPNRFRVMTIRFELCSSCGCKLSRC